MSESRFERFLLTMLNPKVGIPIFVVLVLLAAPFAYRSSRLAGLPDIGDPFDVEAFGTVEITDEENAFIEYREAAALLTEMTEAARESYFKVEEEGWSAANEELRQWMRDNRAVLEIWRKGTEKPRALYHQPHSLQIETVLTINQELRNFVRLARLEGLQLEAEGNFQDAWEWYSAAFRCSRHSGQHGTMIERLVGIALHNISAEPIEQWSRDPRVTTVQLREALEAIQTDFRTTLPTSTNYKVEYVKFRNSLAEPNLTELIDQFGSSRPWGSAIELGNVPFFLENEPEATRRISQHFYANWLEFVDTPRHARPAQSERVELFQTAVPASLGSQVLSASEIESHILRAPLAGVFLRGMSQFDQAVGREQARQAALEVSLAAQIYRREQGRFPDKAADLLDGILDALPADPFGKAGETMHYRRDPEGFTVWSIGTNETNDGGYVAGPEWDPFSADSGYEVKSQAEESSGVPEPPGGSPSSFGAADE
jgi:hypothetical protein